MYLYKVIRNFFVVFPLNNGEGVTQTRSGRFRKEENLSALPEYEHVLM